LLAAIAIPAFRRIRMKAQATTVANNLRQFSHAIQTYALEFGKYPSNANTGVVPTEMVGRLSSTAWTSTIPGGSRYDFDQNVGGIHAAVSIIGASNSDPLMLQVDRIFDDGNIATGEFRWVSDRYMYILMP